MRARVLRLTMLMALLAGCVSTNHSQAQSDSPPPPAGSPPVCVPAAPAVTPTLPQGDSCIYLVRADQQLTRTPLAINPGETYRITLPRNQVWYDASRRNVPPDGEPGSWMMNLAKHWKRVPESQWFALIAANVSRNVNSIEQYESQDISKNHDLKFKQPGQLAFFPNDAVVPILGDFYTNNSGQVWVQIEHCPVAC